MLVRRILGSHLSSQNKAYKGLKTGGYADGAHHSAMLERARSGGECWNNPPRQGYVSMKEARVDEQGPNRVKIVKAKCTYNGA